MLLLYIGYSRRQAHGLVKFRQCWCVFHRKLEGSRGSSMPKGPPKAIPMNTSNATNDVHEVLQAVGLDHRGLYFVLLMLGIAAVTCALGTMILECATRSSSKASALQRPQPSPVAAQAVGAAGPSEVEITVPETQGFKEGQGAQAVSTKTRRKQTLVVFLGTYGLCLAATLHGVATRSLNKESGLLWESYVLLLTAGCVWLLVQAAVLAKTLAPGRGYPRTAFAEAMLSGICPFVSDAFDTLKDMLFGGFCWQSANAGIRAMGVICWIYLLAFHVVLMLIPIYGHSF